jgi:hypothetical protein
MQVCGLTEEPMVGVLKDMITDAILDSRIPNEHNAAMQYLLSMKNSIMNQAPLKKVGD